MVSGNLLYRLRGWEWRAGLVVRLPNARVTLVRNSSPSMEAA
jgi:hypothetical protein